MAPDVRVTGRSPNTRTKIQLLSQTHRNLQASGLYQHISPPRAVPALKPAVVRQWLKEGDLDRLQQLVTDGQGHRLLGERPPQQAARLFLRNLPGLMARQEAVHAATESGRTEEVVAMLRGEDGARLALSKDAAGLGLLHKAILRGHHELAQQLITSFPATVALRDHEGRTALHYCGASPDPARTWALLEGAGADQDVVDRRGNRAKHYMSSKTAYNGSGGSSVGSQRNAATTNELPVAVTRAHIRKWIHERDLGRLERLVWAGQGERLLPETSASPRVRRFLEAVPCILSIIKEVHAAAVTNNVPLWRMRTSPPVPAQLVMSQDKNGLTPLHKAAGLGHVEIVRDILDRAPEAAAVRDVNRRSPLHFAAVRRDSNDAFHLLKDAGADDSLVDSKGRSASYYAQHPMELDCSGLMLTPDAPRAPSTLPSSWNWSMLAQDTEPGLPSLLSKPPLPSIPRNTAAPRPTNLPPPRPNLPKPSVPLPKPGNPISKTVNPPPNPPVSKSDYQPIAPEPNTTQVFKKPLIEPVLNTVPKTAPRTAMSTLSMAAAALSYMRTPPMRNHAATPPTTFSFNPNMSTRNPLGTTKPFYNESLSRTYPMFVPQTAPLNVVPAIGSQESQIPSTAPSLEPKIPSTASSLERHVVNNAPSFEPKAPDTASSFEPKAPDTASSFEPKAPDTASSFEPKYPDTTSSSGSSTLPSSKDENTTSNGPTASHRIEDEIKTVEEKMVGSPLRPISPPGSRMPAPLIERWIRAGDFARLEDALLEGRGSRVMKLLGSAARNNDFRAFVERAPGFMDGMRRMHAAAAAGDTAEVSSLVSTYRRIVLARDEEGAQPMHVAARAGHVDVLQMLLKVFPRGVSVTDWEGRTPLHHAGMCPDLTHALPCYQLMLLHGAPESVKDAIGNKAADYLAETRALQPGIEEIPAPLDTVDSRLSTGQAAPDTPARVQNISETHADRFNTANIESSLINVASNPGTPGVNKRVIGTGQKITPYPETPADRKYPETPQEMYPRTPGTGMTSQGLKVTEYPETPAAAAMPQVEKVTMNGSLISKDLTVPMTSSRPDPALEEARRLVEANNTEKLAEMVLNGHGEKLIGMTSSNPYVQGLLDHVPVYMAKIAAVHEAAARGDIVTLQASLERRKFVTSRDKFGATPLHKAVLFGQVDVSRYLGGRFPETLDAQDHAGRGPVHYAAVLPDRGVLYRALLALGADPRLRDKRGHTALDYQLHHEQRRNHEQILSELGADPAFAAHTPDPARAAASGAAATATLDMLQQPPQTPAAGATFVKPPSRHPAAWTQDGQYLATNVGDPLLKGLTEVSNVRPKDPIAFLANYLYNFPNSKSHLPSSPAGQVQPASQVSGVVRGMPEVLADNQAPAPGNTAFKRADSSNRLQTAGSMTSANGSTNRDEHGQSMLHFAAARSHSRNAFSQLLREAGLSVGQRDALYRTPRDVALEAGLPENARDIDNWVLHLALEGDTERLEELLLDGYEHILDVKDANGASIVELAQRSNVQESLAFLKAIPGFEGKREWVHKAIRVGSLEHVREVMTTSRLAVARNSKGRCSLHVAALCQQEHIVEYIAGKFPITLGAGDNLERTALHYAMAMDKAEVLSMVLVKAGAKRVLKDLKGRQASFYFVNRGDILKLKEEEQQQEKPKK